MKLKLTKARERHNHFLAESYTLLRRYQDGKAPNNGVSAGALTPELTWLCDNLLALYDGMHRERKKAPTPAQGDGKEGM